MRSFGLSFECKAVERASGVDLCPGSSERMSDGSQRGVECENTLRNLAFISYLSYPYSNSCLRCVATCTQNGEGDRGSETKIEAQGRCGLDECMTGDTGIGALFGSNRSVVCGGRPWSDKHIAPYLLRADTALLRDSIK